MDLELLDTFVTVVRLQEQDRTDPGIPGFLAAAADPPRRAGVHTEWGMTGTLMLALPDREFIVALDPTLFLVKDPELYRVWYRIPRDPQPGVAETYGNVSERAT